MEGVDLVYCPICGTRFEEKEIIEIPKSLGKREYVTPCPVCGNVIVLLTGQKVSERDSRWTAIRMNYE